MRPLVALLTLSLALAACDDHDHDHDRGHSHEGPHGGQLVGLGSVAHFELVHDAKAGSAKLWLTGPDAKTPLPIPSGPVLKLTTDAGPLALGMNPVADGASAAWALTHDALKTDHLDGRVTIEIDGKPYNPDLEATHDH